MISYWFSRYGHACPAINYFKVTFFGTFIIWTESVFYVSGCCMSCKLYALVSCWLYASDGWPKFQSIYDGLQSIATDDEKHYQCQNIVLSEKKNWTIIFGIQLVNSITVCTDGRSRHSWECWQRHESIWHRTIRLFVSVTYFVLVVLFSDSFTVVPKSWAYFKALNVLCWSEKPHVGCPPALSEVVCTSIQILSTSSFASLNVTFFADVLFSLIVQKLHKDIQGF